MKIAVIGAGVSGLVASSILSKKYQVDIYEASSKVGRKILQSGNGRCNITNDNLDTKFYKNIEYFDIDLNLFKKYLNEINIALYKDEEGRNYPYSNTSKSFLNILLKNNENTNIYLNALINKITIKDNKVVLNDTYIYDIVIIATGSCASFVLEKQQMMYDLVKSLNINITKLQPSLVGLKLDNINKKLEGKRFKALCKLYKDDVLVYEEKGEIIFKKDGISGIVIMNISHYYDIYDNKTYKLKLDIYPDINIFDLKNNLLSYVDPDLIDIFKEENKVIKFLKDTTYLITGKYDFLFSQVVSGGVDISQVNKDFSLKKYNNIYIIGEVLDVNGMCGGYNITFASLSGIKCANNILKRIK